MKTKLLTDDKIL